MEHRSDASGPKGRLPSASKPARRIPMILVATIVLTALTLLLSNAGGESPEQGESGWQVKVIEPELVSIVPHDPTAFSQGLEIHNGKFYESTGLYGESSVRIVNMSTGEIEVQHDLSDEYFGEGLTIWNDSVIQLTWRENTGFIYDLETLEPIGNFTYSGEGWGLCARDDEIWMSDGSSSIMRMSEDFSTVEEEMEIRVHGLSLDRWNELECRGFIFANRWYDDSMYAIVPYHKNGIGPVCEKVDFSAIRDEFESEDSGVLNGIAYDNESRTWWVTGKNWSNYYEVKIGFRGGIFDYNCEAISNPVIPRLPGLYGWLDQYIPMWFVSTVLVYSAILLVLISPFAFYRRWKRQTEKPPRLSEEK